MTCKPASPSFGKLGVPKLRRRVLAICIAEVIVVPANANTLTQHDVEMLDGLATNAQRIEEDIQNYKAGRLATGQVDPLNTACWEELFNVMTGVKMDLIHSALTVSLSSRMINKQDEINALIATKADTEGTIAVIASARKVVGAVQGACSSDALLIETSQRASSFFDEADTGLRSLDPRLPSM